MTMPIALFDLLIGAVACAVALPAAVLLLQVTAGASRRRRVVPPSSPSRPRIAALMPAHDEAAGITPSIASVLAQLRPGDRLLVVADNCEDDTADIARRAGAEVVERRDLARRGKGYALDCGVRHLAAAAPEVLVIVDADCLLAAGALDALAETAVARGRPAQALYLMRSPPEAGVKTHVAEFAWIVRNQARPLGCLALGWPCQLMGTGMAFPWPTIAAASLASGHLVEDMELGLALAVAGTPPCFCPEALVTSVFPDGDQGSTAQRTRWEHGHLAMIASRGLPMLARGLFTLRLPLAALALDLCVPPLASLVLMVVAVNVCAAAWWASMGSGWPLAVAAAALLAIAAAVAIAWLRHARAVVSIGEMLSVPGYVLGKIPIYLRWFTGRQTEWIRTRRDDSSSR